MRIQFRRGSGSDGYASRWINEGLDSELEQLVYLEGFNPSPSPTWVICFANVCRAGNSEI
jgi:hypothetical protein